MKKKKPEKYFQSMEYTRKKLAYLIGISQPSLSCGDADHVVALILRVIRKSHKITRK